MVDEQGWEIYDHRYMNPIAQKNLLGAGLKVILVVANAPSWAVGEDVQTERNEPDNGPCEPVAPPTDGPNDDWQDWRNFVEGVVQRWGAPQFGVIAIQAWNEPNNPNFWKGDAFQVQPHQFAELVNVAARAVGDRLLVLPGGLQPRLSASAGVPEGVIVTNFMRAATQGGSGSVIDPDLVDAMPFHLYSNEAQRIEKLRIRIIENLYDDVWAEMTERLRSKDRWITEVGFPSNTILGRTFGTARTQAKRLADMYIRFGRRNPVKAFIVHRMIDGDPSDPLEAGNFGVINGSCVPRPAHRELAQLVTGNPPPSRENLPC